MELTLRILRYVWYSFLGLLAACMRPALYASASRLGSK